MIDVTKWLYAPLKRYIAQYLRSKLSKFVYNVDLQDFSLYGEDSIVLKDLELNLGRPLA